MQTLFGGIRDRIDLIIPPSEGYACALTSYMGVLIANNRIPDISSRASGWIDTHNTAIIIKDSSLQSGRKPTGALKDPYRVSVDYETDIVYDLKRGLEVRLQS